jgi:hypothetical protein
VLGDAGGAGGDEFMIAPLSSGAPRLLARQTSCGTRPSWLPDSKTLAVYSGDRGPGRIDADTGAFTSIPERYEGYVAWSPGGGYVAYGDGGEIVVESSTGAVKYRVPYDINCCTGGFTVHGVSADGRYVGVNYAPSDPGGVRGTMRVVDMTTGQEITLPVPMSGRVLSHVLFLADGGMLVQTRPEGGGSMTLQLVSAGGQLAQTLPQSGVLSDAFPSVYLP